MLYKVAAFAAIVASADALTIGVGPAVRMPSVQMAADPLKYDRLPGEGDPFNGGNGMRRAEDLEGPRPDLGQARRELDCGYIEEDDEPWHASCKPKICAPVSKDALESAFTAAIPFMAAEEALGDALVKATGPDDIDKMILDCIAAGGRAGCPAIMDAAKLQKSMVKAMKEGKEMPKAKAKKVSAGGATPGWTDKREIAKVHDNSV